MGRGEIECPVCHDRADGDDVDYFGMCSYCVRQELRRLRERVKTLEEMVGWRDKQLANARRNMKRHL